MTIVREEENGNNDHHAGGVWRGGHCPSSLDTRAGALVRFGVIDRRAQDRSDGKPDDTVQNTVGRLCGRAASRAKNGDAVRAADIVPTH